MQSRSVAHDTPLRIFSEPSTLVLVQALAPPVGSVEVNTSPRLSVTTHRSSDAHDTLLSSPPSESTFVVVQALAPPVGFVEVNTAPFRTATHRPVDGHDTAAIPLPRLAVDHASAPPVGSVELSTSPTPSTATHKPGDGHDAPVMATGDANGGWSSARTGLAQLRGDAASAGPASARRLPASTIARTPTVQNVVCFRSRGTLRHRLHHNPLLAHP